MAYQLDRNSDAYLKKSQKLFAELGDLPFVVLESKDNKDLSYYVSYFIENGNFLPIPGNFQTDKYNENFAITLIKKDKTL